MQDILLDLITIGIFVLGYVTVDLFVHFRRKNKRDFTSGLQPGNDRRG